MAIAGQGYRFHTTGLTHDERGYPATSDDSAQIALIQRLVDKIEKNRDKILMVEEIGLEDAEIGIIAYGISARTALWPMEMARQQGIKVGMLRLITVWPFPEEQIRALASRVKAIVVPEINMGQIVLEVERCAGGKVPVIGVPHPGGGIHKPQAVLAAIKQVM